MGLTHHLPNIFYHSGMLLIKVFLLFPIVIRGQAGQTILNLQIERISVEDGLPSNNINVVLQDSQGFLWVGTSAGLSRYDGYSFKTFQHIPGDEQSLRDNTVTKLLEDKQGYIWVKSTSLDRFDPRTELFRRFSFRGFYQPFLDHSGTIWNGYGRALFKFNTERSTFDTIPINPTAGIEGFWSLFMDKKGELWGTRRDGLTRFDTASNSFRFHLIRGKDITFITEDNRENLWLGSTDRDLFVLDRERSESTRVKNDSVLYFMEDRQGNIWTTGLNGLAVTVRSTGKTIKAPYRPGDFGSLISNDIFTLYQDKNDVIWAGTYGNGLLKIQLLPQQFKTYPNNNHPDFSIVRSICEDAEGNPVVAFQNGLLKWENQRSDWVRMRIPLLSENSAVWKVLRDASGVFWIGTRYDGLVRYDPETRKSRVFDLRKDGNLNALWSLLEDRNGNIWVGASTQSLFKITPEDGEIHPIEFPEEVQVYCIYEDEPGHLWIGTSEGLYKMEVAPGNESAYLFKKIQDPNDVSTGSYPISAIHVDRSGQMWIGTYGLGLKRFSRQNGSFEDVDALPNPFVYGILEDEEQNLWISTNLGISRFSPETGFISNFTKADGLQGNEFNMGACFKNETGKMYFGGSLGLNAFYPKNFITHTNPPNIFLTQLLVAGQPVQLFQEDLSESGLQTISALHLKYNANSLYLEFASSDLSSPEKNSFAYRIGNGDWTYLGSQHTLLFPYLSTGTYPLQIKGTNRDGVWCAEPLSLSIVVHSPWWKTTYFYLAIGVLFLAILFGAWRWRISFFRENERRNLKILEERTKELETTQKKLNHSERMAFLGMITAGLTHELKNPINAILNSTYGLEEEMQLLFEQLKQNEKVSSQLSDAQWSSAAPKEMRAIIFQALQDLKLGSHRIAEIVEVFTDFSRAGSGAKEPTDIHQCIEESLRLVQSKLTDHIFIHKEFDPSLKKISCIKVEINQVLLNLIANALEAMDGKGNLRIKTERVDQYLKISISDNGPGIEQKLLSLLFTPFYTTKPAGQGTGLGLTICYDIVQQHNGEIRVSSTPGVGTTFEVLVPYHEVGGQ